MITKKWLWVLAPLALGCSSPGGRGPSAGEGAAPAAAEGAKAPPKAAAADAAAKGPAALGQKAPDFSLTDLDGNAVKLSDYRGKTVVLEWFNADCPFVKKNHTEGPLKDMAKKVSAQGVVWLAINSSAPGKQGHGAANREGKQRYGLAHPILLDESGEVGHLYGATNTPHMYVVDPAGVLVYRGAIDNAPDGDPRGDHFINYVEAALADVAAGRPVATPEVKAYGCSVKYAN
jgi:peroxiredoxin